MKLKELSKKSGLKELGKLDGSLNITGINDRSSTVKANEIFVAIKGFEHDGHDKITDAVNNGAALVIGQAEAVDLSVPYIQVPNSRFAFGQLAAAYYDFPAKNKIIIGITGTNGKTTTAYYLRHLLKKAGKKVAFFGTVINEVNGEITESQLTTPHAGDLQKALTESEDEYVVIECSSQGLDQDRLAGMTFDYAIFINLKRDHITYHASLENYYLAKKKLFSMLKPHGKAIVNGEDAYGKRLLSELSEEGIAVCKLGESTDSDAECHYQSMDEIEVTFNQDSGVLQTPLTGKYNALNLALASIPVVSEGIFKLDEISEQMRDFEGVPGRMESYKINDNLTAIIDYAHTTDAIEVLLETLRYHYPTRHFVQVFGFRGGRDVEKRRPMVTASLEYGDELILTNDELNEVPLGEMTAYNQQFLQPRLTVEMDRTLAIQRAFERAGEHPDKGLVIITGKGLESYGPVYHLPTTNDKETIEYLRESYSLNKI